MNNLQVMTRTALVISLINSNTQNLATKDDVKAVCSCMKNILDLLGQCPFIPHKGKFYGEDAFSNSDFPNEYRDSLKMAIKVAYGSPEELKSMKDETDEGDLENVYKQTNQN